MTCLQQVNAMVSSTAVITNFIAFSKTTAMEDFKEDESKWQTQNQITWSPE
jgi:hypothetical protein